MNRFTTTLPLFFILLTIALCSACRRAPVAPCEEALRNAMADFRYGGAIDTTSEAQTLLPDDELAVPFEWKQGKIHVFFHKRPLNNSLMARETLPDRLRRSGFIVQPLTDADFAYADAGGPLFTLRFSGRCRGKIFNIVDRALQKDPKLLDEWATEVYLIRIEP